MKRKRNQKRLLLLFAGLVIVAAITLDLLRTAPDIVGAPKRILIETIKSNYHEQPGKSETGTGLAQSAVGAAGLALENRTYGKSPQVEISEPVIGKG